MPTVIHYSAVIDRLNHDGLQCVYPNSGAFAFPTSAAAHVVAWAGPDDATIRPTARAFVHFVPLPWEATLATMAMQAWQDALPAGPLWVLPKSHWAFELDFGSGDWLPAALRLAGVDPAGLQPRTTGDAIEFGPDEAPAARSFMESLLMHLAGSDFLLAFPGRRAACTVHHHKQLWWTTPDASLADRLRLLVSR